MDRHTGSERASTRKGTLLFSRSGRYTAATLAGLSLLLTTAGPSLADDTTAVGVGASAYVDDYAFDVFVEQQIESALLAGGFQDVGVFVNVSHGT